MLAKQGLFGIHCDDQEVVVEQPGPFDAPLSPAVAEVGVGGHQDAVHFKTMFKSARLIIALSLIGGVSLAAIIE
ncbi:hypothetical protein ACFWPU_06980 [Streptomyces sp. NPDC058471]|uniref:hypothetical protein n=1 Tax=Streptomyces sp. NPDC058471 TaxID=3346516 RepID=UPI0036541B06